MHRPLIVTLTIDDAAHAWFNALRSAYFPPERLVVGAHVTMFHAIPAVCEARLLDLAASACVERQPFSIAVTGIRFLGRGVAFALHAPEAESLRAQLAGHFADDLTPQDKARWSPHITLQNKVDPGVARRTADELASLARPDAVRAGGLAVWRYDGGPWRDLARFHFGSPK